MSNVCRFTGEQLNSECPSIGDNNCNGQGAAIDFEQNSYWNNKQGCNLSSLTGSDALRRIDGPLRVNGDILIEGDIIGRQGAFLFDDISTTGVNGSNNTLEDLENKNILLENRLMEAEKIINYFCERFSVNKDAIDKETKKLHERTQIDKRLDAIE